MLDMTLASDIVSLFRSPAADSQLIGAAGLFPKCPVIVADQMLGARGAPSSVVLDDGGETYAIHATHPTYGRRVAALITLGHRWVDAAAPEAVGAAIPIDCGRIVQLGAVSAAKLRSWPGGERWLAGRNGPPASHEVETPDGLATVIVSSTGIGDGSCGLYAGFRPRKKEASILIVDFDLIGRDGWTAARARY